MEPMQESTVSQEMLDLRAERARYRGLAAGALRDLAINRMLEAGRKAAIVVLMSLPDDEREALEAGIGATIGKATAQGFDVRMGTESLKLKE